MNGHAKENPMTNSPYLLFNQSRAQLRRIGARGGKAQARNRRARLQAQTQAQPHPGTVLPPLAQTAAQAITVLDAQFPWLCGAEKFLFAIRYLRQQPYAFQKDRTDLGAGLG